MRISQLNSGQTAPMIKKKSHSTKNYMCLRVEKIYQSLTGNFEAYSWLNFYHIVGQSNKSRQLADILTNFQPACLNCERRAIHFNPMIN